MTPTKTLQYIFKTGLDSAETCTHMEASPLSVCKDLVGLTSKIGMSITSADSTFLPMRTWSKFGKQISKTLSRKICH